MLEVREELLNKALECVGACGNIIVFDEIDSTNNIAKQMAAQGIEAGTLIVANRQSAGRGRMGRSFLSPGNGVYFSIILRPDNSIENVLKITSGAAVAVKRVIDKLCDNVKIKWVNDIYINQKKVCGILAEAASCNSKVAEYIIVGIGINVFGRSDDFGPELSEIVTTIEENTDYSLDKNMLIAQIYKEFLDIYSALDNFKDIMEEYREHSLVIGRSVDMIRADERRSVKVLDIDDEGALIAVDEKNGEEIKISSGEVSIRLN